MRQQIRDRFATATELAHASGVDPRVIQRFLDGERDIRLETAGRMAHALSLRLVPVGSKRPRKESPPNAPVATPEPAIEAALEAPADVDAGEAVSG